MKLLQGILPSTEKVNKSSVASITEFYNEARAGNLSLGQVVHIDDINLNRRYEGDFSTTPVSSVSYTTHGQRIRVFANIQSSVIPGDRVVSARCSAFDAESIVTTYDYDDSISFRNILAPEGEEQDFLLPYFHGAPVESFIYAGPYAGTGAEDIGRVVGSIDRLTLVNVSIKKLAANNNIGLVRLDIHANEIVELNIKGCTALMVLLCSNNYFTDLDTDGLGSLYALDIGSTFLTNLDTLNLPALQYLSANFTRLITLDLEHCPLAKEISVQAAELRRVTLGNSPAFHSLNFSDNTDLTAVDGTGYTGCDTGLILNNCGMLLDDVYDMLDSFSNASSAERGNIAILNNPASLGGVIVESGKRTASDVINLMVAKGYSIVI